jgi:hypothetical protein
VRRRKQSILARRTELCGEADTQPLGSRHPNGRTAANILDKALAAIILSRPGSFKSAEKPALSPNSGGQSAVCRHTVNAVI